MTFAEAFNPSIEAHDRLGRDLMSARLMAFGEGRQAGTMRRADSINIIDDKYAPILNPLSERMKTRMRIINDPNTSEAERKAQRKDLARETKQFDKIDARKQKKLAPLEQANNTDNAVILTLDDQNRRQTGSQLLTNEAVQWDAAKQRQGKGKGKGDSSSSLALAPGMGIAGGVGIGGAAAGGGGGK